ncbi:MAG TPA: hypothetical protein VL171_14775 [Verrucomicrobiae bacterium]|nr:hypothetical protein [Verrucomicrobiae bacterium]
MKNVLYILGAGFSAPLGLPLMNDFMSKSKDMFVLDPKKYAYFEDVYKQVDRLSRSKLYMRCNLHNIEDILSILEMESYIAGDKLAKEFSNFIADVVRHHTPEIKPYPGRLPGNWYTFLFGYDTNQFRYGAFISSLASLRFS